MIFLCFKKKKLCFCVTGFLMNLDYVEAFYLSILEKEKVFGNWESNNFLAGSFKKKCQQSETIQRVKTVRRNLGKKCPQYLSHQIYCLLWSFISAYVIWICSIRQAWEHMLNNIHGIYSYIVMRTFCTSHVLWPCEYFAWASTDPFSIIHL